MSLSRASFLGLFLLFSCVCRGQSVGLALSGGGAKGLYHIGVIAALEENGIPIDYISGTSMGSIIGGLYAIGYTPQQMQKEFSSPEVMNWITGRIDNKYKFYFKQMRRNASMLTLRIDFNNRMRAVQVPSGIVPSNQMDMAFVKYFAAASAACGDDFDGLMVPFRCVATDALNRRPVIYRGGDLGRAIRTSMTIPFVFKPVKTDTTLLYDGGMSNNFPWQILDEDFHPDVIIGSQCVEGHRDPDENSFLDQVFSLTMLSTDYTIPEERGIIVSRIMDDVSLLDFQKVDYIVRCGYEDAMAAMPEIKRRIARRVEPADLAARRREFRASMPALVFDDYDITGLQPGQKHYVERLLKLDGRSRRDSMRNFDRFRSEYFKILSEGELESEFPTTHYNDSTGRFTLGMKMSTKPGLKLMLGGNISSTALNQIYVGFEYRHLGRVTQTFNLDGYLSSFYLSGSVQGRTDFFIRAPIYFEYGATTNRYNFFRSNYGFLSPGHDLSYSIYNDTYGWVSFGTPLGRHSVMRVQANVGRERYRYFQTSGSEHVDTLDHTRFSFVGVEVGVERRNLNYLMYPTRGVEQRFNLFYISGREHFTPGTCGTQLGQPVSSSHHDWFGARFVRTHYLPFRGVKWFSLGYHVDATLTSHPSFSNDYATNISSPAFTPTPHSKIVYLKEFRSSSYLGLGLMPTFEFSRRFYLRASAYGFIPEEYGVSDEGIRSRIRYIFDLSLVYQTLLGPASLSLSQYDSNRNNWFVTLNFGLTIFNRKGIFH